MKLIKRSLGLLSAMAVLYAGVVTWRDWRAHRSSTVLDVTIGTVQGWFSKSGEAAGPLLDKAAQSGGDIVTRAPQTASRIGWDPTWGPIILTALIALLLVVVVSKMAAKPKGRKGSR